eukprot:10809084-Alexandrium_andersonii.AAC.1
MAAEAAPPVATASQCVWPRRAAKKANTIKAPKGPLQRCGGGIPPTGGEPSLKAHAAPKRPELVHAAPVGHVIGGGVENDGAVLTGPKDGVGPAVAAEAPARQDPVQGACHGARQRGGEVAEELQA